MEIEKSLTYYGLDDKEAHIYTTSLQLGKETAFKIAQRCGLKRTTVYNKLNELNRKGFITISQTKKATYYTAVSPQKFKQQLTFRQNKLEEMMPMLMAIYKDKPNKPKIQILEGKQGVEQIYKECIDYLKTGDEILAWSSLEHFQKTEYSPYIELFTKRLKSKSYKARELINAGKFEKAYGKRIKEQKNPGHQVRFANEDSFLNDNLIYGDKLAIISLDEELFVILVESKQMAHSFRNLFQLAWRSAKK